MLLSRRVVTRCSARRPGTPYKLSPDDISSPGPYEACAGCPYAIDSGGFGPSARRCALAAGARGLRTCAAAAAGQSFGAAAAVASPLVGALPASDIEDCHIPCPVAGANRTPPLILPTDALQPARVSPVTEAQSFHRRPLPSSLIPFSSREGKKLFAECMEKGGLEGYFPLAENFNTQAEPAYCALGTLVMVLNALNIDPQRVWKGSWRWWSEEMFDCCKPLTRVQKDGINFSEFACLARCNGVHARETPASKGTLHEFREHIKFATSREDVHLVVSFSRKSLGQTGDGHFSPIGAYHAGSDMVLIMDVARFKYPPYWCSVEQMWEAMQPLDSTTGRSRGYYLISKERHLIDTVAPVSGCATSCPTFCKTTSGNLSGKTFRELSRSFAETAREALSSSKDVQDVGVAASVVFEQISPALQSQIAAYAQYVQQISDRDVPRELFQTCRSSAACADIASSGPRTRTLSTSASSSPTNSNPDFATIRLLLNSIRNTEAFQSISNLFARWAASQPNSDAPADAWWSSPGSREVATLLFLAIPTRLVPKPIQDAVRGLPSDLQTEVVRLRSSILNDIKVA